MLADSLPSWELELHVSVLVGLLDLGTFLSFGLHVDMSPATYLERQNLLDFSCAGVREGTHVKTRRVCRGAQAR